MFILVCKISKNNFDEELFNKFIEFNSKNQKIFKILILSNFLISFENSKVYVKVNRNVEGISLYNFAHKIFPKNRIIECESYVLLKDNLDLFNINTKYISEYVTIHSLSYINNIIEDFNFNIQILLYKDYTIDKLNTKTINNIEKEDFYTIIICYNLIEILKKTYYLNKDKVKNLIIITDYTDHNTISFCKKELINYFTFDILENKILNKSKAINLTFNKIKLNNYILLLDCDIILSSKIDIKSLKKNTMYLAERLICSTYDDFLNNNFKKIKEPTGLGFFQLFYYNKNLTYPSNNSGRISENEIWSDRIFSSYFKEKKNIQNVYHLGEINQEWKKSSDDILIDKHINSKKQTESINKEIVVYTCISGNYDNLKEVVEPEYNIDYVCFTDSDISSNTWEIRKIPEFLIFLEPTKRARCLKILPHLFLEDYKTSVWVDGAIEVLGNINELINLKLKNNFAISKHPDRSCIYQEALKIIEMNKDSEEIVNKQINKYRKMNYPENFGLVQSGVIIRNHNKKEVIEFCELWWNELLKNSKRDQLSFNFALWLISIEIDIIQPSIISSKYLQIWTHINRGSKRAGVRKTYDNIKNYINGKEV